MPEHHCPDACIMSRGPQSPQPIRDLKTPHYHSIFQKALSLPPFPGLYGHGKKASQHGSQKTEQSQGARKGAPDQGFDLEFPPVSRIARIWAGLGFCSSSFRIMSEDTLFGFLYLWLSVNRTVPTLKM